MSLYQKDVSRIDLLIWHVSFVLDFRLEEEGDDEDHGCHEANDDGFQGRDVWVDHLPGDVVLDGSVGRVEPVPGQQNGQVRWGVKHERGQRVQEVWVDD